MALTLLAFSIFVGFGFILWIVGSLFEYTGIAVIGGAIVIGAGAMVVSDGGLAYETGVNTTKTTSTVEVPADSVELATHVSSRDVSGQDTDSTGVEFSNDGNVMFHAGAQNDAIYQYSTSEFDLSLASFERSFDVSTEDGTPTGVEFNDDGTRMYVTGDDSDSIYQYDLTEAFNVSTASLDGSLSVSGHVSSPRAVEFNHDGSVMYVAGGTTSEIHRYDLSTPFNVTSASHVSDFDVSGQEGTPTGLDFSDDGDRMLIVGEDSDTIFEYDLSTAFDINSASYSGESLDIAGEVTRGSDIAFVDNERSIFVSDRQASTIEQYDATTTETIDETTETKRFETVDTGNRFPFGLLTTLVGGVMIIRRLDQEGQ